MPTKRTPLNRDRRRRVHPEAVQLWRKFLAGDTSTDLRSEINELMMVMPWEPCPCEVDGPEPPGGVLAGTVYVEAWPEIWKLRQELDRAAGNPDGD